MHLYCSASVMQHNCYIRMGCTWCIASMFVSVAMVKVQLSSLLSLIKYTNNIHANANHAMSCKEGGALVDDCHLFVNDLYLSYRLMST